MALCFLALGCQGSGTRTTGDPVQHAAAPTPAPDTSSARTLIDDADASAAENDGALAQPCPKVAAGVVVAKVAHKKLDEISGLAVSRSQDGVLWVHNDSGDDARIFAVDTQGALLLEVALKGAEAEDYEDIAIGPGPEPGKSYLYVGDIGDNRKRRPRVQIYRLEEPSIAASEGKQVTARVHRLDVTYEGGPDDAESLMSDPRTGDLYIVGKAGFLQLTRKVSVYRIRASDLHLREAKAEKVAEVPLGPATAGDIMPDGSGIAIRNYMRLLFWPRGPTQSVADALRENKPCKLPLADMGEQGEALGFRGDGRGYFTMSEGVARPMFFHAFE